MNATGYRGRMNATGYRGRMNATGYRGRMNATGYRGRAYLFSLKMLVKVLPMSWYFSSRPLAATAGNLPRK